ncbi:MAG: tyrosine-type recombinase/integrase [Firmicutes bacterium]|nr:tyrosine-type recombinase/integrase [Bacillota bacterium]
MSEKRRDKKGRILRDGESQRPDGKYEYKYSDANGIRRSVYSWRLVETDKIPTGKRYCISLREIEKNLSKDIDDGIDFHKARRVTLNDFYDAYIETKYELKSSTRANYKYMYKKYVRESIGAHKISGIKYSDIKKFYISLIRDFGFKPNSVEIIQTILHPVFTSAVRDGIIRINPTDNVIAEIKKSHNWEKPKRHALTVSQQNRFIEFVSSSKTYKNWLTLISTLLGTGCRIGEILGLRWEDCDFETGIISINHNLIYRAQETGVCEYHITTPKTKAGERIIPMFNDVKRMLEKEYERQKENGFNEFIIDGYTNFIFRNRFDEPLNPHVVNRVIERMIRDANMIEEEVAKVEKREPVLLPHFSCHHLRHTFCTRLCENETNIKVIQEIMGHKSIETTMDVYNEATKEKKIESFAALEGKIRLS